MISDACRGRSARARTALLLLCAAAGTAMLAPRAWSTAEDAKPYVLDAQKQIAAGDLRAAEIQLRNAARANPGDPTIRLELSQIYLRLGNFPAAEAEARVARQNGASDDQSAPLLADAMLHQGKIEQLLDQIRPGNRTAKAE